MAVLAIVVIIGWDRTKSSNERFPNSSRESQLARPQVGGVRPNLGFKKKPCGVCGGAKAGASKNAAIERLQQQHQRREMLMQQQQQQQQGIPLTPEQNNWN